MAEKGENARQMAFWTIYGVIVDWQVIRTRTRHLADLPAPLRALRSEYAPLNRYFYPNDVSVKWPGPFGSG
jgi:hypothetical protein